MRAFLLVLVLAVGCKKNPEPAPDPTPTGPPPSGHSVTQIKDDDGSGKAHTGSGEATVDASLYGGNGKAAYRDDQGHLHGPGGPIFMGRGVEGTDKINHCLRDGVWFAVGNCKAGSLYRATRVFEFEDKWWSFRKDEPDYQMLLKTKVTKKDD